MSASSGSITICVPAVMQSLHEFTIPSVNQRSCSFNLYYNDETTDSFSTSGHWISNLIDNSEDRRDGQILLRLL
jgi:hypothetical protein